MAVYILLLVSLALIQSVRPEALTVDVEFKGNKKEADQITLDTKKGIEQIRSSSGATLKDYNNKYVVMKDTSKKGDCLVVKNRQLPSLSKETKNLKLMKGSKPADIPVSETIKYEVDVKTRPLSDSEKALLGDSVASFCAGKNVVAAVEITPSKKAADKQARDLEGDELVPVEDTGYEEKRGCCYKRFVRCVRVCSQRAQRYCCYYKYGYCKRYCTKYVPHCYNKYVTQTRYVCPCY